MELNNNLGNIFYPSNPARMLDALWALISACDINPADMLIFLPSRRAVRSVEKMLVEKTGGALILPRLVALGEAADDAEDIIADDAVISNTARTVLLAKLLAADANVGNIATALPIANDLVRMTDYMENEGIDISAVRWDELIGEKYAAHFQAKARMLEILTSVLPGMYDGRATVVRARNAGIRGWIDCLDKYRLVIVCGSTASVPATRDLMVAVAGRENGRIILPGKISGRVCDFELNTNPYNSEYKFLCEIGCDPTAVTEIDVGRSVIDFFNASFGNDPAVPRAGNDLRHCSLIECEREADEAAVVAEIAARAIKQNKTVLVITPDAAGGQRISAAFAAREIQADFSGGISGAMTAAGRAILNLFDGWVENKSDAFDKLYAAAGGDLFRMIVNLIDAGNIAFSPAFVADDPAYRDIWAAIRHISECISAAGIDLTASDARAFLSDALSRVVIRPVMPDAPSVAVLGTIESRMQTADIVILTGLNDGMFPARGYENAWLPRGIADKIGLPPADRKVSLMSLDFMNLSSGPRVYWTRSKSAGGTQTTESRFLSRVFARGAILNADAGPDIYRAVLARDNIAPVSLDYSAPTPPADWSDVYVTELELLVHNPYAFYVRHILRLRPRDDYWAGPDMRKFGTLVHSVIENARDLTPGALIAQMDAAARAILGSDSIIFHFWHKRFVEIAPVVSDVLARLSPDGRTEIAGAATIAGRVVRARADRVWDGGVLDIKTGAAPGRAQLFAGNMPQIGLEAYMLQSGGFPIRTSAPGRTPDIVFLQLKNKDARPIEYTGDDAEKIIQAAVDKTTQLFNIYSAGAAAYEYRATNDQKYHVYDDLARIDDL